MFAIGLNYRDHAAEAGLELPDRPKVSTKLPESVTGPYGDIAPPSGAVDYEAELVAVIGIPARNVAVHDAWSHIAGLTVGGSNAGLAVITYSP